MTQDARFEDASEKPLNLGAQEAADIPVIAALIQDAVVGIADVSWRPAQRQLVFLINRYRWERPDHAGAVPERVRSLLVIDNVLNVASMGVDKSDRDLVLSLLDLSYAPGADGTGELMLILAGDGAVRMRIEALELRLRDVTRPYHAPSGKTPDHDL